MSYSNTFHTPVSGNTIAIELSKGYYACIDHIDAARVKEYKWTLSKSKGKLSAYRLATVRHLGITKRVRISLARYIIGAKPGEIVAFKDGNSLNCIRSNLYIKDKANRVDRSSKDKIFYEGVVRANRPHMWKAKVLRPDFTTYLSGAYRSQAEAAHKRDLMILHIHGDNEHTRSSFVFNFPDLLPVLLKADTDLDEF